MSTTINVERCGNCTHTQNWHIGVTGGFLNGHMVACRFKECDCERWVPTWK